MSIPLQIYMIVVEDDYGVNRANFMILHNNKAYLRWRPWDAGEDGSNAHPDGAVYTVEFIVTGAKFVELEHKPGVACFADEEKMDRLLTTGLNPIIHVRDVDGILDSSEQLVQQLLAMYEEMQAEKGDQE
jgi:hypothetical protein